MRTLYVLLVAVTWAGMLRAQSGVKLHKFGSITISQSRSIKGVPQVVATVVLTDCLFRGTSRRDALGLLYLSRKHQVHLPMKDAPCEHS